MYIIKYYKALPFERILFYSCLLVSLLVVVSNVTNPTLDGPAHLYNAQIINYLIHGNKFISNYYTLNKVPVANLTDHYLLALFLNFFSWQAAEKIIDILYLLSFSLLFRMLIRQWNSSNIGLSIFAIPFSFSYMYYIGFYNFCLSFPLLFGIIIYYRKHFSDIGHVPSLKKYSILCLLFTLIYFTNGLAFLFVGLVLVSYEIFLLIPLFSTKISIEKRVVLKRLLFFFLVGVPGLLFFIVFLHKVPVHSGKGSLSFSELMHWIYITRPLFAYALTEYKYPQCFFYLITVALLIAIYYRVKKKDKIAFNSSDVLLFLSVITLFIYLITADDASVGMMSVRLCYFFFIFLLLWIASQQGSKIVTWIISVLAIAFISPY